MSINTQNSRHLIKRSTLTGVIPTTPVSSDFTDGTWLNTDTRKGEFFLNLADEKLWIGVNAGFMPIASTLEDSLTNGNNTGANDIIIDTNRVIKSGNGGGQISLDIGGSPNSISISTDNDAYGESYIYLDAGSMQYQGGVMNFYTDYMGIDSPEYMLRGKNYLSTSNMMIYYKDNVTSTVIPTLSGPPSNIVIASNKPSAGVTQSIAAGLIGVSLISSKNCSVTGSANSGYSIISGESNVVNTTIGASLTTGISNTNNSGSNIITGFLNTDNGGTSVLCGGGNTNDGYHNYVGGTSNTMRTNSSLVIGDNNNMLNFGIMYGVGVPTPASAGLCILSQTTTGLVSNNLETNANLTNNSSFLIDLNTSNRVSITVVCIDSSTGDTKEWTANALIKNIAGTTSLVGTITFASTFGDAALSTATVTAAANNTTDALDITVTGITGKTLRWVGDIKYVLIKK